MEMLESKEASHLVVAEALNLKRLKIRASSLLWSVDQSLVSQVAGAADILPLVFLIAEAISMGVARLADVCGCRLVRQ